MVDNLPEQVKAGNTSRNMTMTAVLCCRDFAEAAGKSAEVWGIWGNCAGEIAEVTMLNLKTEIIGTAPRPEQRVVSTTKENIAKNESESSFSSSMCSATSDGVGHCVRCQ